MALSVVFDLDGTLITCENKQKFVLYSIVSRFSTLENSKLNEWWKLKRNGINTENALNQLGFPSASLISREWERTIEDFTWCLLDKPFEDSLASLEDLKNNFQFKIIILTARKSKLQPIQAIQRFGFTDFIDDIIVVNPKNAFQEKANYLKQINPVLFVGDTESDYNASVKSGINFIALSRGQRSYQFLKNSGIKQIENNLKFLKDIDKISRFKKD